ncbi:ABC transporter permease [Cupriavidus oxalaticus]|uniref:Transport permease protein n=1 Tax=Cupriavidus oxalaticus TaxID=96344 RepID=A0A4V1BXV8_9BURK|nr:ABC transporter permease [Cupriavidus oxalaticus]QBY49672.1 ABC transporter [Cupriavidus oxalaticus]
MTTHQSRKSLTITFAVWKALFLREALSRFFSERAAWFWLFAEPVFHVAYLLFIYTVISVHTVGGIDTAVWIMVGMLAFFMFNRTGTQVMNALSANQALFTYRQVKPVDTTLVRAGLEGFLMIVIASLLLAGAALWGHNVAPADPLAVLESFFGLWLVGLGFGLIVSVPNQLMPGVGRTIKLMLMPLYMISGVMFPIALVSQPYRDWLLFNPVAHGLEAARLAFAPYYHAAPGLSIAYLYGWGLVTVFLGLALHRRFALKLVTQ